MDQSYSSWANLTSEIDACGVCEGDNSTCTDDCGVVNGDGSTCLQKSQDDDNFPDYGIALVVIGGVAALAGVAGIVVSMGLCCSSDNTNAQVVQNTGMEMSDKA